MTTYIDARPASTDWKAPMLVGYAIIALAFGGFGGWAVLTQIDGAVVAPAFVAIETNSKVVQHLEEGIVSTVLVKEADHVDAGQVLIRLSDVTAKASLRTVRNQLASAMILEARLWAERDGKSQIDFPKDLPNGVDDAVVAKSMTDQSAEFADRQKSLEGQLAILEARKQGLNTQIQGLAVQQDSTTRQVGYIKQELGVLRDLYAEKLVTLDRLLTMERERTRLEGEIGQAIASQAQVHDQIGEAQMQINEIKRKFQEETAAAISDVGQKISDLREKEAVASDVMSRIDVRAPVTGTVQALKVYGGGQVIRPGESLMEIVPDSEDLVVRAEFSPTDIANVHSGQEAEVRFPSFHSRTIPVITGDLTSVSHDRLLDDATHNAYYLGLVSVSKTNIPSDMLRRLRAGMPAEVIVTVGKRSVFNYLTAPLSDAWRGSFRE